MHGDIDKMAYGAGTRSMNARKCVEPYRCYRAPSLSAAPFSPHTIEAELVVGEQLAKIDRAKESIYLCTQELHHKHFNVDIKMMNSKKSL